MKNDIFKRKFKIKENKLGYEYMYEMTRRKRRKSPVVLFAAALLACAVTISALGSCEGAPKTAASSEDENYIASLEANYRADGGAVNDTVADSLDKILQNFNKYPPEYIDLLKRNEETITFVADYIDYKPDKRASIDTSGDLTSGKIPLFIQWDKRWGYMTYSDAPMCINGCGPTALAMVVAGLTGRSDVNPKSIADFAVNNNYYVKGVGTSWALMSEGAVSYGLTSEELPMSESAVKNALMDGKPVIASMKAGTFTDSGHFIVLIGVSDDGSIIIHDPNSYIKSAQTWDFSVFQNEARNFWAFSKAAT